MTVTEQGCAELAERLRADANYVRVRWSIPDVICTDLERAATLIERLTVEELAEALHNAENHATGYEVAWEDEVASEKNYSRVVAAKLLDHITAETEVKA